MPFSSQGGTDNLPVGTILAYSGNLADIPNGWHLCDGTDGTPNLLDNRFLEGEANIGIYKEPGLPNITGIVGNRVSYNTNGAFKKGMGYNQIGPEWTYDTECVNFDASRSNLIYGASSTVQPKSYTVYYIIKLK